MTDVTPQEFLEHLSNPDMARVRAQCIEMLRNTEYQLLDVTTANWDADSDTTTVTIRLRING